MIGTTRKLALATAAVATLAVLGAACGGKKSSTPPTGAIVVRGNGTPADFACNGQFADPASTGTNVGFNVLTTFQALNGDTPSLGGTFVAQVDIATASTTGAAVVSASNGTVTLTTPDSVRVHLKGRHPDVGGTQYIDTYSWSFLTPAVGATSGQVALRLIPKTIYDAFIGFIGVPPSSLAGTVQFAGAVGDCTSQDAQIANATVEITGGHLCKESATPPCIAYIHGAAPDVGATHTDSTGAFIIVGLPASTPTTVKVMGITTAGQAATQIGELIVNGKPDTISLGVTNPVGP